jgi:hypothetical protein
MAKGDLVAELTSKSRDRLKASQFGLPGRRYPVEDASHAKNAKARAEQQYEKGNLSASDKAKVDRKANSVLGNDKKK